MQEGGSNSNRYRTCYIPQTFIQEENTEQLQIYFFLESNFWTKFVRVGLVGGCGVLAMCSWRTGQPDAPSHTFHMLSGGEHGLERAHLDPLKHLAKRSLKDKTKALVGRKKIFSG